MTVTTPVFDVLDEPQVLSRDIVLMPASMLKPRPVRWMWDLTAPGQPPTSEGRIPLYTLCIAAGQGGLGKSQFAVWMCARVTTGTLPGELWGSPSNVLYAATEDAWEFTILPRLVAAGADLNKVFRIDVDDIEDAHATLTLPRDTSALGKVAEAYGVGLVVLGPLLSVLDASVNDYRAAEVRRALEPLVKTAERHHFTILGLAHFTKTGAADPLARISGSGAFGHLVRSAFAFAKQESAEEETQFVLSQIKNNLGREGLPSFSYTIEPVTVETDEGPSYVSRFVLGKESFTSVRDVMRDEASPDRGTGGDAVAWLRGYLADVGGEADMQGIKQAAKGAGFSGSAIDRAKGDAGIGHRGTGFGTARRSIWLLPEA